MSTSLLLLTLVHAVGSLAPSPDWKDDYRLALQRGQLEKKPLAIFINSGKNGWGETATEKELSRDVQKLLAQKYVCLYVDASTESGKSLAQSFEASRLPTVVLSDRNRAYQVHRHSGKMDNVQLAQVLQRHVATAVPVRVVQPTVTRPTVTRSTYYQSTPATPAVYSVPCRG